MVTDAVAAIDFLECRSQIGRYNLSKCGDGENHVPPYSFHLNEIPVVDSTNIYIAGYSLGGNVACIQQQLNKSELLVLHRLQDLHLIKQISIRSQHMGLSAYMISML